MLKGKSAQGVWRVPMNLVHGREVLGTRRVRSSWEMKSLSCFVVGNSVGYTGWTSGPSFSWLQWSIWEAGASEKTGTECLAFWKVDCRPLPLVEPLSQTPSLLALLKLRETVYSSGQATSSSCLNINAPLLPSLALPNLTPCWPQPTTQRLGVAQRSIKKVLIPSFRSSTCLPFTPLGKRSLGFCLGRLPFHYSHSPKTTGTRQKLRF